MFPGDFLRSNLKSSRYSDSELAVYTFEILSRLLKNFEWDFSRSKTFANRDTLLLIFTLPHISQLCVAQLRKIRIEIRFWQLVDQIQIAVLAVAKPASILSFAPWTKHREPSLSRSWWGSALTLVAALVLGHLDRSPSTLAL